MIYPSFFMRIQNLVTFVILCESRKNLNITKKMSQKQHHMETVFCRHIFCEKPLNYTSLSFNLFLRYGVLQFTWKRYCELHQTSGSTPITFRILLVTRSRFVRNSFILVPFMFKVMFPFTRMKMVSATSEVFPK